jgi:hypothetical protein
MYNVSVLVFIFAAKVIPIDIIQSFIVTKYAGRITPAYAGKTTSEQHEWLRK